MLSHYLFWNDRNASGKDGRLFVTLPEQAPTLDEARQSNEDNSLPDSLPRGGILQAHLNASDVAEEQPAPVALLPLRQILNVELSTPTVLSVKKLDELPSPSGSKGTTAISNSDDDEPQLFDRRNLPRTIAQQATLLQLQVPSDVKPGAEADAAKHLLDCMFQHLKYYVRYYSASPHERAERNKVKALAKEIDQVLAEQEGASDELQSLVDENAKLKHVTSLLNTEVVDLRSKVQRASAPRPPMEDDEDDIDEDSEEDIVDEDGQQLDISNFGLQPDSETEGDRLVAELLGEEEASGGVQKHKKKKVKRSELLPSGEAAEALVELGKQITILSKELEAIAMENTALSTEATALADKKQLLESQRDALDDSIAAQKENRIITQQIVVEHLQKENHRLQEAVSTARETAKEVQTNEEAMLELHKNIQQEFEWREANTVEGEVAKAREALREQHKEELLLERKKVKEREDEDVERALYLKGNHQDRLDEARSLRREKRRQEREQFVQDTIRTGGIDVTGGTAPGAENVTEAELELQSAEIRVAKCRAIRDRLKVAIAGVENDSTCLVDENAAFRELLAPLQAEYKTLNDAVGVTTQHLRSVQQDIIDSRAECDRILKEKERELDASFGEVLAHRAAELDEWRSRHRQLQQTMDIVNSTVSEHHDMYAPSKTLQQHSTTTATTMAMVAAAPGGRSRLADCGDGNGSSTAALLGSLPPELRSGMMHDV